MKHVSVSPTDGNGPTQGQRKTLTRVGISELHFFRAFCGSTRLHGHTTSTRVLTQSTLFVFRWKTVWKMFSFCIFGWFQSSLTHHDICGPHWWLRSYLSQASEGHKLKAECLFLICLELLFSLYCNCWHIFRSSLSQPQFLY